MNVLQLFPTENSARGADAKPKVPTDFDEFWAIWPRRTAKRDAQRAWARLSPKDQTAAMQALPRHVEYWRVCGTERQFIPHPATWLNGARWEDEVEIPQPRQASGQPGRHAGPPPNLLDNWTALDAKARELRIETARLGESQSAYRARVIQALEDRDRLARFG